MRGSGRATRQPISGLLAAASGWGGSGTRPGARGGAGTTQPSGRGTEPRAVGPGVAAPAAARTPGGMEGRVPPDL